jgi:hypothetical protein
VLRSIWIPAAARKTSTVIRRSATPTAEGAPKATATAPSQC